MKNEERRLSSNRDVTRAVPQVWSPDRAHEHHLEQVRNSLGPALPLKFENHCIGAL